jgi:hypothetical protein
LPQIRNENRKTRPIALKTETAGESGTTVERRNTIPNTITQPPMETKAPLSTTPHRCVLGRIEDADNCSEEHTHWEEQDVKDGVHTQCGR